MGDSKVTVWERDGEAGAGCAGETDGDVLKRGICGNKTGGAEEQRHSISHLTTLTGERGKHTHTHTHMHHTVYNHSMWVTLNTQQARTWSRACTCTHIQ